MVYHGETQQTALPGMEEKAVELPKLKPQHEEFCRQYVLRNNDGKAAYLAVFPNVTPDSAKTMACKLLKKTAIAGYVAAYRQQLRDELETRVINYHRQVLSVDRRVFLSEHGNLRNLVDLDEDAAAILEIEQVNTKDGVRTLAKIPTRHQSAAELSKILGLQKAAAVELPGENGNVVVSITL